MQEAEAEAGMVKRFLNRHPFLKDFLQKFGKDNVGMLAAAVAWNTLTSMVPILVGLAAISGIILQDPSKQVTVTAHLSQALHGVLSPADITAIVKATTQHAGILGIVGFIGVLWGGANVGGAISTAFQALFEVKGRSFVKEKLIDMGMIFVFAILMLIIIAATAAGTLLDQLFRGFPIPGAVQFVIGTLIALAAAFLLFAVIYLVFPNVTPRFKMVNVWKGALVATVLFQILSYVWPLYSGVAHFHKYGAVLFPILLLTAWIYFFSMILLVGGEIVAISAIREAEAQGQPVGPEPQEQVPQHRVMRG